MTAPVAGRRVVVTGMGAVSGIGVGLREFAAALRAGRSAAAPATSFDTTGFPSEIVCEVRDFVAGDWIRTLDPARLGRAAQFAAAAARMAVLDAGLEPEALARRRGLVTIGTTNGESQDVDELTAVDVRHGPDRMRPELARRVPPQTIATSVARELGLSDVDARVIGTACSAGNYAIGEGLDAIRLGLADYVLCGGSDAVSRKTFAAFHRLGLVAPDACRPFDAERRGIVTGEGAGVLLLESAEHATARGARVHAEVLGYGLNCDGEHPVAPSRSSVARCMRLALRDAGVKPEEVGFVSAHGTGTQLNDITECEAIRDVYGDRPPPVVSLKSMLGHTMGAASALAAIGCVLALTGEFIPPTINHRRTDPACDIDCVPNVARPARVDVVQNNGFAFGGDNAVVVLGRYDGRER